MRGSEGEVEGCDMGRTALGTRRQEWETALDERVLSPAWIPLSPPFCSARRLRPHHQWLTVPAGNGYQLSPSHDLGTADRVRAVDAVLLAQTQ